MPEVANDTEVALGGVRLREHDRERTEDECVRSGWVREHIDTCVPEPHGSSLSIQSLFGFGSLSLSLTCLLSLKVIYCPILCINISLYIFKFINTY